MKRQMVILKERQERRRVYYVFTSRIFNKNVPDLEKYLLRHRDLDLLQYFQFSSDHTSMAVQHFVKNPFGAYIPHLSDSDWDDRQPLWRQAGLFDSIVLNRKHKVESNPGVDPGPPVMCLTLEEWEIFCNRNRLLPCPFDEDDIMPEFEPGFEPGFECYTEDLTESLFPACSVGSMYRPDISEDTIAEDLNTFLTQSGAWTDYRIIRSSGNLPDWYVLDREAEKVEIISNDSVLVYHANPQSGCISGSKPKLKVYTPETFENTFIVRE
jgi:hypothetical protein